MARIQILELPMEHVGPMSGTPFVLVFDRLDSNLVVNHAGEAVVTLPSRLESEIVTNIDGIKEVTGARGVLVFSDEIEVG